MHVYQSKYFVLRLSDLHISTVIEYAFALRLERRLQKCGGFDVHDKTSSSSR